MSDSNLGQVGPWIILAALVTGFVWGRIHRFRHKDGYWLGALLSYASYFLAPLYVVSVGAMKLESMLETRESDRWFAEDLKGRTILSATESDLYTTFELGRKDSIAGQQDAVEIRVRKYKPVTRQQILSDSAYAGALSAILGGLAAATSRSIRLWPEKRERRGFDVVTRTQATSQDCD